MKEPYVWEDWHGCPEIGALIQFPMFITVCNIVGEKSNPDQNHVPNIHFRIRNSVDTAKYNVYIREWPYTATESISVNIKFSEYY